jgi:molybdopterin-guanine dinucleotide biosynthesis protein A
MRSALILAGGSGKRLNYREKALIPIMGRTMIEHILEKLDPIVDQVIISVRDEAQKSLLEKYTPDRIMVPDKYSDVGPLAGILEGLKAAEEEYIFIVACDMPFLNVEVVEQLFQRARGHDAAIPIWDNEKMEPLHAVYRTTSMLFETQKAILRGDRIILAPVFNLDDVVSVSIDEIHKVDLELRTLININTLEDIELLNEIR